MRPLCLVTILVIPLVGLAACDAYTLTEAPLTPNVSRIRTVDGFDYPVGFGECAGHPLTSYTVSVDFLDPTYPLRNIVHTGEDWNRITGSGDGNRDLGDPVCAVGDGKVVVTGAYNQPGNQWGSIVVVEHLLPDGTIRWSQYAHLNVIVVAMDDSVVRGQQVGTIGQQFPNRPCLPTGLNCAHLHFEIRQANLAPDASWRRTAVDAVRQNYVDPTDVSTDINPERGFIEDHRISISPFPNVPPARTLAVLEGPQWVGYIDQCAVSLPSYTGYKGYWNGVEVWTTGQFGGFPCFNGDRFVDNLSLLVGSPLTSGVLEFYFWAAQDIGFVGAPIVVAKWAFNGTSWSGS